MTADQTKKAERHWWENSTSIQGRR